MVLTNASCCVQVEVLGGMSVKAGIRAQEDDCRTYGEREREYNK